MSVHYRLVSPQELDESAIAVWRAIQSTHPAFASPYFCPEFTQTVASVRRDVRVVVIENHGCPVGFFPHQRSALGMGRPVGGPFSDYHGVIAASGSDWDLHELMRAARLSVWAFDHLAGETRRFAGCIATSDSSPQIDLREGYAKYAEERRAAGSDYIPKTEGLARKCTREHGEIEFILRDSDPKALDQMFQWKSEQYRRSGIPDGFGVSWTRELLRRICGFQGDTFAGVCSTLRINRRIVAVHMGMRSRDVLHYWFPAYDPEFAKYSVGILLLLRTAAALSPLGVRMIDLGKGTDPYKVRLMTGGAPVHDGWVQQPSILASALHTLRHAEARAAQGGLWAALRLPLRAIHRMERLRKFH